MAKQATLLQIDRFSRRSIHDDDLVTIVPGVGPKLNEKLKAVGIVKAKDLYNHLSRNGFNKERFSTWMSNNVSTKHARVPVIYESLKQWHEQYGGDVGQRNGNTFGTPSPGGAAPAAARQAPEREEATDVRPQPDNELMQYVGSFSNIFKKIPDEFHLEFRQDILNIAGKYEKKIKLKEKVRPELR